MVLNLRLCTSCSNRSKTHWAVSPVVEIGVLRYASLFGTVEKDIVQLISVSRVFDMHGSALAMHIILGS